MQNVKWYYLSYDSYSKVRNEDKDKIEKLGNDMESQLEMDKIFLLIQQNPILYYLKLEILKGI